MATTARLMTAEELLEMPDDGFRYELVRGELVKIAPTKNHHGEIAAYVTGSLVPHVRRNRLGRVYTADAGFVLASEPAHVRVPDVGFVQRENVERIGRPDSLWPEQPDLAIEVISPSDRYSDVMEKVSDYFEAGTLMVNLLDSRALLPSGVSLTTTTPVAPAPGSMFSSTPSTSTSGSSASTSSIRM